MYDIVSKHCPYTHHVSVYPCAHINASQYTVNCSMSRQGETWTTVNHKGSNIIVIPNS